MTFQDWRCSSSCSTPKVFVASEPSWVRTIFPATTRKRCTAPTTWSGLYAARPCPDIIRSARVRWGLGGTWAPLSTRSSSTLRRTVIVCVCVRGADPGFLAVSPLVTYAVITPLNSTQLNWTKSRKFSVGREVLNMLRISRLTANRRLSCWVEFLKIISPEPTQLSWPAEWPQRPMPVELCRVGWCDRVLSHKPDSRLPLLLTRPAVTFPAKQITPLAGTKLYCSVTKAHRCK